jgi:AraC-like DNA-binding protein
MAPGTTIVGVRFRPGAAPAAFGLPADEIVDQTIEAQVLWGDPAGALGELLEAAGTPEAALAALQRQLAARLVGAAGPDPIIAEAVRQLRWATDDVGSLTSSLSISERQLRRRFQAATGHGPKTLHRTLRFQRFLALAQHAIARGGSPAGDGLARLAAEAGYSDQPHLNRECLRLTGATPGAFLGEAEDHCGCGHDHAASYLPLLAARPPARA